LSVSGSGQANELKETESRENKREPQRGGKTFHKRRDGVVEPTRNKGTHLGRRNSLVTGTTVCREKEQKQLRDKLQDRCE